MTSYKVSEYQIMPDKILGKTKNSIVYIGHDKENHNVVIKVVNKQADDHHNYRIALNQIKLLKSMHSPRVVTLLDSFEEKDNIFIVEEFIGSSTLTHLISEQVRLNNQKAQIISKKLLEGLQYLHSCQIMHHDLKPDNIIYNQENVVIIDFGLSCTIEKDDPPNLEKWSGTLPYVSPQILKFQKHNSKSDIWSFGIILYQMVYGRLPFMGDNRKELLKQIQEKNIFRSSRKPSFILRRLIERCLKANVSDRINWSDLFDWMRTNRLNEPHNKKSGCGCFG